MRHTVHYERIDMNYIPDKPKASDILEFARDKGVGVESSNKALMTKWCDDSIVDLDKALHRIEHRVEDIARSKNRDLDDGFWLGVLFGLFIGKGPVVD